MRPPSLVCLAVCLTALNLEGAEDGLRVSVYATAGDVQRYLVTTASREKVVELCRRLQVSRLFLEGRRGDEYVAPNDLRQARDFLATQGIHTSGGIATVPGELFGTRQNEGLGWLDWESDKTRRDVAGFFTANAPLFDELIVDDFYCTADTSPGAARARGQRSWGDYRRDLLVSLLWIAQLRSASMPSATNSGRTA